MPAPPPAATPAGPTRVSPPWRIGNEPPLPPYPRHGPKTPPWMADVRWTEPGKVPGALLERNVKVWFTKNPRTTYASWALDTRKFAGVTIGPSGPGRVPAELDRDLAASFRSAIRDARLATTVKSRDEGWGWSVPKGGVSVELGTGWFEGIPGHQTLVTRTYQYPKGEVPEALHRVVDAARTYAAAAARLPEQAPAAG